MTSPTEELDLSTLESNNTLVANGINARTSSYALSSNRSTIHNGVLTPTARRARGLAECISTERFFEICFDSNIKVIPPDAFEKGKQLGSGSIATGYRGVLTKTSKVVALKYFNTSLSSGIRPPFGGQQDSQAVIEKLLLELQILSHPKIRNHDNIQDLIAVGWCTESGADTMHINSLYPVVITDLACERHPTLGHVLANPTPFSLRLELLRDVVEGLTAVHGLQSVLADIRPESILVYESTVHNRIIAKLSNFEYRQSQSIGRIDAALVSSWTAPECLVAAPAQLRQFAMSNTRDIYSFGLIASYILTEEAPFAHFGKNVDNISTFKLQDKLSDLLASRWRRKYTQTSDDSQLYEFLRNGKWNIQEGAPGIFLDLLPRLVRLHPSQRPDLADARSTLSTHMASRAETDLPNEMFEPLPRDSSRKYVAGHAWEADTDLGDLSPQSPPGMKQQMHQNLLQRSKAAGDGTAMVRYYLLLGDFFVQGFEAPKGLDEAIKWYVLAAQKGSAQAMAMIFRLERVLQRPITELNTDITHEMRTTWMIECMTEGIRKQFDPSLASSGDINEMELRMRQALKVDPWLASTGLRQDLDMYVAQLKSYSHTIAPDSPIVAQILGLPEGQLVMSALSTDDAQVLDDLIQNSVGLQSVLPRLVGLAAEMGAVNIIDLLANRYRLNVDLVDIEGGKVNPPLAMAAMRSDFPVFQALLECGADHTPLMARGTMDTIVRVGSDQMLKEALNAILARGVNEPIQELFNTVNMCHQVLDGVCLAMRFIRQGAPDEIPPDNSNPPPLFEAIAFNRIDKIQSLLMRGANPNVFAQGLSALSLAVRMCRPMAVLLLLAFGADPNVRNSAHGYGCPLHDLCDDTLKAALRGSDARQPYRPVDLLGRDYEPLSETDDEYDIRRVLILRILIIYGARTTLQSIEGFTPLMVAIASPTRHALTLVKQFLQAGVSLIDRGLRGETAVHVAILAGNDAALQILLEVPGDESIVDIKDDGGLTPLCLAIIQSDTNQTIDQLLTAGADVSIRGLDGMTALDIALVEEKKTVIVGLLQHLEKLPPVERAKMFGIAEPSGRNVFHFVTCLSDQEFQTEVASKLLSWNSEAKILVVKDKTNLSAMDCAKHKAIPDIVKLFQEHLQVHSVRVIERKPTGLEKQTYEKEFSTLKVYSQPENEIRRREDAHADLCYRSIEDTGSNTPGQPVLTSAEVGNWKMLDSVTQEHGGHDPLTLWCMNNLGTVHERYGRLLKAQEIFYHGWVLSKQVLGDESGLARDFACKVLRVIKCRGLEGIEGLDVSSWQTEHGKETLRAFFSIVSQLEYERLQAEGITTAARNTESSTVRICDRDRCEKPSCLTCPECEYARYCSETCLANDIMDPNSDHLSVCFPTDALTQTPAMIVQPKHLEESEGIINLCWMNIQKNFPHLSKVSRPPMILSVTQINLNPSALQKGVACILKANSVVMFLNHEFCEAKVLIRPPSHWKKLSDMSLFMAVMDVTMCLRPTADCSETGETRHIPFMAMIQFQDSVAWLANPNAPPPPINTSIPSNPQISEESYTMSGARSPEDLRAASSQQQLLPPVQRQLTTPGLPIPPQQLQLQQQQQKPTKLQKPLTNRNSTFSSISPPIPSPSPPQPSSGTDQTSQSRLKKLKIFSKQQPR